MRFKGYHIQYLHKWFKFRKLDQKVNLPDDVKSFFKIKIHVFTVNVLLQNCFVTKHNVTLRVAGPIALINNYDYFDLMCLSESRNGYMSANIDLIKPAMNQIKVLTGLLSKKRFD